MTVGTWLNNEEHSSGLINPKIKIIIVWISVIMYVIYSFLIIDNQRETSKTVYNLSMVLELEVQGSYFGRFLFGDFEWIFL